MIFIVIKTFIYPHVVWIIMFMWLSYKFKLLKKLYGWGGNGEFYGHLINYLLGNSGK